MFDERVAEGEGVWYFGGVLLVRISSDTGGGELREILDNLFFLVGLNDNVRRRISDAGEDETTVHLLVVEEAVVGLVDGAGDHLAAAGRAGPRPARVIRPMLLPDFSPNCAGEKFEMALRLPPAAGFRDRNELLIMLPAERVAILGGFLLLG
nr:hypothetical protein THAOC_27321 [Ipomoea batatas]